MNDKEYLVKDVNLVTLTKWLNEHFKTKKSGERFSTSDIQGYIRRGHIPDYLGGNEIESDSERVEGTTSYSVIK